jgi:DNA-binding NtrC family response regulator
MPEMDGVSLLAECRKENMETPFILMTAYGTVETAIKAMKLGVFDYVMKPFSLDEMELTVKRALEVKTHQQEAEYLKDELKTVYGQGKIIGEDARMKEVFSLIEQVAPSDTSVLITGESGTGKELVASALHYLSHRCERPFVKLNCGALTQSLIESELFGHVRGAFTGAIKDKNGRFSLADNGSIFLDEIGEVTLATQVKLLRVLQEGEFEAVGSDRTSTVNVRVIAATNRNLKEEISKGNFREDLYYRLNVITIELPPLRERGEDVLLLAEWFLTSYSKRYNKTIKGFTKETQEALLNYNWPGNVRELENIVERAVVLCREQEITMQLLPTDIRSPQLDLNCISRQGRKLPDLLEEIEKNLLLEALNKHHWVQTKAASALGITRTTLQYRMQKFELVPPGESE